MQIGASYLCCHHVAIRNHMLPSSCVKARHLAHRPLTITSRNRHLHTKMLSSRVLLAATAKHSAARSLRVASSSVFAPALFAGGRSSARFAALQLPVHAAFSTFSKKDDETSGLPPLQTVEELIAENESLKKKVAELEDKISKAKPGLFATMKQYGMPFFIWWTSLYVMTGVGFYAAFDTGLLNGAQVIDFVMSIGLDKIIDPERLDPKHGTLALAFIVNEAAEPLRFPFAIATIPMIKRVFSKEKVEETK